jgi:hypothetical protein
MTPVSELTGLEADVPPADDLGDRWRMIAWQSTRVPEAQR